MAYREFTDSAGTAWRAWDTLPLAASALRKVQPALAAGWLTFESSLGKRRLAPIPLGWERASVEQLESWCRAASAVPRSRDADARPG